MTERTSRSERVLKIASFLSQSQRVVATSGWDLLLIVGMPKCGGGRQVTGTRVQLQICKLVNTVHICTS